MNPSLLLIPDRYKAAKLYSQIPDTGAGDLDFTRVGDTATRVNASGLIEPVLANIPRIDYTGGGCGKLLLEPQRTNLITFSEQIDNVGWTKTNANIIANNTISPDGFINADKVIATTTNGVHRIEQDRAVAAQVATQSVFAKASGYNFIALENGGEVAYFNLATGVVGTVSGGSASIQNYGNGWYRCIFTATGLNTKSYFYIANADNSISFAGDNASGVFMYGTQFEVESYVSSYIPTLGATVTRGADVCSKTGISSLIGQTEGTVFVDENFLPNAINTTGLDDVLIAFSDGTLNNFIAIIHYGTGSVGSFNGRIRAFVRVGGVNEVIIDSTPQSAGKFKIAFSYSQDDFVLYVNGQLIGASTSGSVPATNRVFLYDLITSQSPNMPQAINTTALYTTRLLNAELEALTTL